MPDPAILTIRRDWPRPDPAELEALRGVATGFIVDAMGRSGALGHEIRSVWDGPSFVGAALPVHTTARDNLAPYAALRFARPGDVMVIATGAFSGASVIGDIVVGMMRNVGIVGVVTDGLVRDVSGIIDVGLPVHAAGVSPNSPFKHGPGTVGLPIAIGGAPVEPGDVVLGDRDGVVVVPRRRLAETIAALEEVRRKEAEMDALVRSGALAPAWLDRVLAGEGVRYVD